MVIPQGVHMREKLRNLSIIDLMFIYLWYEKDGIDGALIIGRGNTSRIQEEQKVVDHETWSTVNLCE